MIHLPMAGAANSEIARLTKEVWMEEARRAGIDLTGFDSNSALVDRAAWAQSVGLDLGSVLSRFSTKLQHSTQAQVRDCTRFAAWHRHYVPPEYVCVDEDTSGRKLRRDGLDRMRSILDQKLVGTLFVFKVSRLFRVAYKGFQFFQESVVEEGLRGISVSQGIDTADQKTWKALCYLHGIMDEMLLTTIADHVRSGLKNLFQQGYITGALTVGFRAVEVPGAPLTNRGRPRTMPEVDPATKELLNQHFHWILDAMPISEGWRQWVAAGGPCDPRATTGRLSYPAYRRLLSNLRLTGRWAFGKKRNVWSSKRDYSLQVIQPETEVALLECDELRIIEDDLYFGVQAVLAALKTGPRGPKKRNGGRDLQLWDLVTQYFHCAHCSVERPTRFYQIGAAGYAMQCKNGVLCPCRTMVSREEAVRAICQALSKLVQQDSDLIKQVTGRAAVIDAQVDETVPAQIADGKKKIACLSRKIDDLTEMAGHGSADDRAQIKAKVAAAQAERAAQQLELTRLGKEKVKTSPAITEQRVREILADLGQLLEDAAEGRLGPDVMYKAGQVFGQLVGNCIQVHIEPRPGRKLPNVRATFQPRLLRFVQTELDLNSPMMDSDPSTVTVWLREPPKRDRLANYVHELIDNDGLSFRDVAARLKKEGHQKINSGVAWQIYHRYYEMIGQPAPRKPYNNGHPRKPE